MPYMRPRRLSFSGIQGPYKKMRSRGPRGSTSRYARRKAATKIQALWRGYRARKALTAPRRRRKTWGGRYGRVRTRLPQPGNTSNVTITEENMQFALWHHNIATTMDDSPLGWRTAHALYVAPVAPAAANDHSVIGNNTSYIGANMRIHLTNYWPDRPQLVRITVVELTEQDTRPLGNDAYTIGQMSRYWKNLTRSNNNETIEAFLAPSFANRANQPHNTNEYRILKQKYIRFYPRAVSSNVATGVTSGTLAAASGTPPTQAISTTTTTGFTNETAWAEKAVHMYIPMRRILDQDNVVACSQGSFTTAGSSTTLNRYVFSKPILLLIEYMHPQMQLTDTDSKIMGVRIYTRHSFKNFS